MPNNGRRGGGKGPRKYCTPECRNKYHQRLFRQEHRQDYFDQQIRSYQNHKDERIKSQNERRRANWSEVKDKQQANSAVYYAVKAGKLFKPVSCSKCGVIPRRIEAHHHKGYGNPLDVVWLCTSCHRKAHHVSRETS